MELLTIQQTLDFINTYYADDRLSVEVPALYGQDIYEIFWHREYQEPRWSVGLKNSNNMEQLNTDELIEFLNKTKLDLVEFQISLLDKILLNIGTIAIILKQARLMLGDSLVDQAIERVEEFYMEIDQTIDEIITTETSSKNKSEDSLKTKNTKQNDVKLKKSKSINKTSLKLVKNNNEE